MLYMNLHAAMFSLQINTTLQAFPKIQSVCGGMIKAYTSSSDMAVRGTLKRTRDHWFKLYIKYNNLIGKEGRQGEDGNSP